MTQINTPFQKFRRFVVVLIAGMTAAALAPGANSASNLAFTVGSFSNASNNPLYIGFEFSVSTQQTVNRLGVLNTNNHSTLPGTTGVGIYSVTPGGTSPKAATAVITAEVPAGTSPSSAGSLSAFMVNVTPTVLPPGNYVLLAETGSSHEGYVTASLSFIPGITYVNGWFAGGIVSFPDVGVNTTVTNQSNGGNNWISATFGVVPPATPTGTTLNFSAASSGSIADSTGQGTGFSTRLPGTGASFTGNDPNLTLNTGSRSLTLRSTPSDVNGSGNLGTAEFPGIPLLSHGISTGSDFMVRATFTNIQASQNYDQFGVYVGSDAQHIVRGGVLNNGNPVLFTALTIPSDNPAVALDYGQNFGSSLTAGDTIVLTLSRVSGQWSFYVWNKTNPAASGFVAITPPNVPDSSLTAGIFAANPGNVTVKVETVKDFYAGQIPASNVTYVGADTTTHGAWRTSGISKPLDGDSNGIYGTDGYVITRTSAIFSPPAYASVAQLAPQQFPGNGGYISIQNPTSVGGILSGLWYDTSGVAGTEQDMASITLGGIVQTRVGILISNTDYADISPDHLRIRQTSGGTGDSGLISTPLNNARNGDWYFFDVSGKPGDVFVISGTNARAGSPAQDSNGIGAITFDSSSSVPVTISTLSLPGATQGSPYAFQFAAANGTTPYTWTGTSLPAGLTISSSGLLSGVPSGSGNAPVTVRVADAASSTATQTFTLQIAANVVPLFVTGSGNLGATSVGKPAGSGSFSATGGKPPYSWTLTGAPSGVSLTANGSSATVGGTPQQAGDFNFAVIVTDTQGLRASASGSVSVLGLSGANLPEGVAFSSYSGSFPVVGGAPPYTFQVQGLPGGLSVSGDGSVRGIPQRAGTFPLTITVSDSRGNSASGSATIVINPAPALTLTSNLPAGSVNAPYSASLAASGGGAPYIFSIAGGSLPDGVRMSSSGSFTGTPTSAGTFTFTARVTDSAATSVTANFAMVIAPPPLSIGAPSPLPTGMVSVDYPAQAVTASGGIAPYTFKVTGGALPAGITVSETGAIGGLPTAAGTSSFVVTATDASGLNASATLGMEVRALTGDLILSEGTLSFNLTAGSTVLPGGATIRVQSTDVARPLAWTVATTTPWLNLTGSTGSTPGSFSIDLTTAAPALTASTTTYSGSIVVTCLTAPCAGRSQTVSVTLLVQAKPAQLTVSTNALAFNGTAANPVALQQTLTLTNTGGGSLGIGSLSCAATWCHLSAPPATLTAGTSANITVTADSLPAGYYYTQIDLATSGGKVTLPVTYYVTGNPTVTLAPAGITTSVTSGGTYSGPAPSFFVTLQNGASVNWTASIAQGDFLRLGTPTGISTPSAPGRLDYSFDATAVAALRPGTYYGTIRVSASGIANSPQDYTVVLTVLGASERQKPTVAPAGLVFSTALGVAPAAQTVRVYTSSETPVPFQWSAWTEDGLPWIVVNNSALVTSASRPEETTVAIDASKLAPGVYRGLVNYAFAAMGVRSVNVTLIVQAPAAGVSLLPRVGGCVPKQIVPTQTGLVTNFSAPASWPVPLEISLFNDCGDPITSGQVVTLFSNGDAPLPLTALDPKTGRYAGTWTPRKTSGQISVTAQATAAGFPGATVKLAGAVTPNNAPVLNKDAVLNIYNPVGGVPAAPGTLVSIKGQYLASQPVTNTKVPLPTILGGTSVIIGGIKAPIASVTPTQVNVQVPAELATGQPYQVIISANGALTTPDGLQMADAAPGLSLLPTGFVNASHQAGGVITEAAPAKPGEAIVIYLAGMGLTTSTVASGEASPNDPAPVANPPSITLDSAAVNYTFAGLTPGLVGVYQINMTVPANTKAGNLTLSLSQAGVASNSGLLPVGK